MPIDASIPAMVRPPERVDPLASLAKVMQLRQLQQQGDLQDVQLQTAQRGQADVQALDAAYASGLDRDGIINRLPGHLRPTVQKQFADADAAALKVQKLRDETNVAERDYFGSLAAGVKAHGYDQGAAMIALQHAKEKGYKDADQLWQRIAKDPTQLQSIVDGLIAQSPKQVELQETSRGHDLTASGQVETNRHNQATEVAAGLTADRQSATHAETTRHNYAMEQIGRLTAGQQEAAQVETARHNAAMEEAARNTKTSRPVVAGDAEDLSNFDTSLDDLKVLRSTIAPIDAKTGKPVTGVTGVSAQIGAAIPSWATDLTGWGTDAKKKQALIDRVKQVIGKALEGGVLRKEDELKYEKILPTVKDTSELVISKLDGLEAAIEKRKGRRLDAMEDAGFNVTRYRSRQPAQEAAKGPAIGTEGVVNGKPAVWKTVGNITGWYAK